jgi:hypothetical protein
MRAHSLIRNFLGLYSSKHDIIKWINTKWKPKGHFDLQVGSKKKFTVIFHNLEDKDRIFKNGPYFFNSASIYLIFWIEQFIPEKEEITYAPLWIILYSLPLEFWLEEILFGIGNTLEIYIKAAETTRKHHYNSYACICVYMNIYKPLPISITLEWQDEEWAQTIDYEHIPFRCHKFHEHGHLF